MPYLVFADAVNYFYDDAGRLVRVLKGTEGLIYQYDAVGNLLSISKGTVGTGSPVFNSIIPDVLFIGSTTLTTINGQNLFTTKEVKPDPDNPSVIIKVVNVTDTEIRTEITVLPDALPGTVSIKVTTLYGSASIPATLTLSKLTFRPGQLPLAPGSSGGITASIFPSIGRDLTITLNNSDPSVASAPQSVIIPSNGTTTFTVNALNEGVAIIDSGSPTTVVFVNIFSVEPGESITNKAGPVSVYIQTPSSANTTTSSLPVSVYIETSASENTTTSSLPLSVYIEQPLGDSTVVSLPVSTQISPP